MSLTRGRYAVWIACVVSALWSVAPASAAEGETPAGRDQGSPPGGAQTGEVEGGPVPDSGAPPVKPQASEAPGEEEASPAAAVEPNGAAPQVEVPAGIAASDRDELDAYQRAFARYNNESLDYQVTVDGIVEAKYRQQVAKIQSAYNAEIDEKTAIERTQRNEAIEALEAFVARHPRDAQYTPDALFRLADLQFEKSNDDYLLADERFQEQMVLFDQGKLADAPVEPMRDYSPTIQAFERLIADWPDYRLLDGARYLLAYSHMQMGAEEEAVAEFRSLIDQHPDSEYVPEAWVRIGEYHFDLGELEEARAAYSEAMNFPESRFYDKALYKLAWTNYREDNFDAAIARFKELVEYSDAQELRTGKSGSVLRAEAIQYIAISLSESDWNQDGITDEGFGLERTRKYLGGDKPYQHEVIAQLAEYLFENGYFVESVDVSRYALAQYPENPRNPQIHEQLVLALLRDEQLEEAFEERRRLGEIYGPESAWFRAQEREGNSEAMRYASNLVRDNLIESATWFHQQAIQERDAALARDDAEMLAAAKKKYALAAKTYADYIAKHPNDRDVYEWTYYLAEALFYSDQFDEAVEQYAVVREMDLSEPKFLEIQEDSGFAAVKALEKIMAREAAAGRLPASLLPPSERATEPAAREEGGEEEGPITPQELPALAREYVTALDRYVVLGFENEEDPNLDAKFAYQAAKLYYDAEDFDEARRRFDWIVSKYPDDEIGAFAASLTLETLRREKKYDQLAAKAEQYESMLKGEQVETLRAEIADYKLASLFKAAESAYQQGRYEEAIENYKQMMSKDTRGEYTPLALINTAVSYEKLGEPGEAASYYERLYQEYPKNDYAPYALFRVAATSERFFEFDRAANNFLAFYDRFGGRKTPDEIRENIPDFELEEKGGEALLSAALLLENMQQYDEATKRLVEYSRKFSDRENADDAYWRAVQIWERTGDRAKALDGYETYASRFGSAENAPNAFRGLVKVANYQAEKGRTSAAKRNYKRVIDLYSSYGVEPGSEAARFAAEAQFKLNEFEFEEWDAIKFRGNQKKQGEAIKRKVAGQQELNKLYENVYPYKSLDWTLATAYRTGNMFQRFAQTLYDAPVPFSEGSEEYDLYRAQLDDLAVPLEDQAVEKYAAVVKQARDEKTMNKWVERAIEELNKFRPAEYPLYKEERSDYVRGATTGMQFLDAETYRSIRGGARSGEGAKRSESEDQS